MITYEEYREMVEGIMKEVVELDEKRKDRMMKKIDELSEFGKSSTFRGKKKFRQILDELVCAVEIVELEIHKGGY